VIVRRASSETTDKDQAMKLSSRAVAASLRAGTALALIATVATQAAAQDAGDFLGNLAAKRIGEVSGMTAWGVEGSDMIWLKGADGNVIAGYVFDGTGADVGSALLGLDPVSVWESLQIPAPSSSSPTGALSWSQVMGAGDVPEPSSTPGSASPVPPAAAAPSVAPEDVTRIAEDALSVIEGTLADIPESEKSALVDELVLAISSATSPEDLQLAILRWTEKATGTRVLPEGFKAPSEAQAPQAAPADPAGTFKPVPFLPEGELIIDPDTGAATPVDQAPWMASTSSEIDRSNPTPESVLNDIRLNGFWFAVGSPGAPAVYMIADPACPYCARAIGNLKQDVEAGRVQLRILLAPFVSSRSPALIAGILFSGDPAGAYWSHSLSYAERGASDLKTYEFSDLPKNVLDAVKGNYDMVIDYELNGVPFFAWSSAEGPKFLSGVPEAGRFSDALADPFNGNMSR
jgi:hypothetical protein